MPQDGSEVDCEVYVWKEVSCLRAATFAPCSLSNHFTLVFLVFIRVVATAFQRSNFMVPGRHLQDRRHLLIDVDWDYDRFRKDHLASYLKVTSRTHLSTLSGAHFTARCNSDSGILPDNHGLPADVPGVSGGVHG